ncbi:IclR family transcriptional regulator C-terminal domain-containing protein [Streptomyces sp. NPDC058084]|uniref:IclR family transcriptional regulator n=1 Tax=Streptomyces sp. NPDC058084 TaxID=3346333 RepID=UPI0036EF2CF6
MSPSSPQVPPSSPETPLSSPDSRRAGPRPRQADLPQAGPRQADLPQAGPRQADLPQAGPRQAGPRQSGPEQAGPEQADPERANSRSAGPRSVDRALALLDAVADADRPVGAKALARTLGCALSTVYHLTGPLITRGLLVRTSEGYAPGPRVPALHRAYQRHHGLGAPVAGLLAQLRRASGAEAYFTAYRDGRITVVDTTAPVTDTAHPFAPGPEARAHATAHGKALLAGLPRALRRRYLDTHGMARFTDRTITSPELFEAELARVRDRGFAVSVGEADPAYTCLATALPGRRDGSLHALSVSLLTTDFRRRHGEVRAALARALPLLAEALPDGAAALTADAVPIPTLPES